MLVEKVSTSSLVSYSSRVGYRFLTYYEVFALMGASLILLVYRDIDILERELVQW